MKCTIALFALALFVGAVSAQVVYSVSGGVYSALDSSSINNASVTFVGPNGTVVAWSDVNGDYDISLLEGTYNMTGARTGYISDWRLINITGTTFGGDADVYLAPTLVFADSWRFLLTWGATPSDLDSYSFAPWNCIAYYGNSAGCLNGTTLLDLDRDDTSGYGPETTTWSNVTVEGRYEFWVNSYSGAPFTPAGQPRAQVDVYTTSSGIIESIRIPPTVDPAVVWWRVFRLDVCTSGTVMTVANTTHAAAPDDDGTYPWANECGSLTGGGGSGSGAATIFLSSFAALFAAIFAF